MPTPIATNTSQVDTTSPVLEFRCLYTFNITQKKKKWQDGMLKFHTRNSRVMVYDTTCNYIGDAHWQGSELQEGDEFELHCGALIQVSDLIRKSTSDISALLDRKRKSDAVEPDSTSRLVTSQSDPSKKKHKSLKSILASQSVQAARPFSGANDNLENCPPRTSTPWSVTATSKRPTTKQPIAPQPKSTTRSKPSNKNQPIPVGQSTFRVKSVIDLTSDSPQESTSPLRQHAKHQTPPRRSIHSIASKAPIESSNLNLNLSSSPPVNSVSKLRNVESFPAVENSSTILAKSRKSGKPLQLSKTKAKGRLLCMQSNDVLSHTNHTLVNDNTRPNHPMDHNPAAQTHHSVKKNATSRIQPDPSLHPIKLNSRQFLNLEDHDSYIDSSLTDPMAIPSSPAKDSTRTSSSLRHVQSKIVMNNIKDNLLPTIAHANRSPLAQAEPKTDFRLEPAKNRRKERIKDDTFLLPAFPASRTPPIPPKDQGPWSIEAMDLFDWRPPDWEVRKMQIPGSALMID